MNIRRTTQMSTNDLYSKFGILKKFNKKQLFWVCAFIVLYSITIIFLTVKTPTNESTKIDIESKKITIETFYSSNKDLYEAKDFTVKWQPGWEVRFTPDGIYSNGEYWDFTLGQWTVTISQYSNEVNNTVEEIISQLPYFDEKSVISRENIELGNAKGVKFFACVGVEGCLNKYLVVVKTDSNKIFIIDYYSSNGESNLNMESFPRMIEQIEFK